MSALQIDPTDDQMFAWVDAAGVELNGSWLNLVRVAHAAGVEAERARATAGLTPEQALLAADVIENPGANWDPAYVRKVVAALKRIAGAS